MKEYFEELGFVYKQSRKYIEAGEKMIYQYYHKAYSETYEREFDYGPVIYKSSIQYSPNKNFLRVEMWNHKMLDYEVYFDGMCRNKEDFDIIRQLIDLR